MLTGIGLRNFKAFGDEMQEAPLSKITLIYGPNSGGKSSVIQALLLLKQSLKPNYDYDWVRRLVPRGEFVDLGSSLAMLHKHQEKRELGIGIKYKNLRYSDLTLRQFSQDTPDNTADNYVRMTFVRDEDSVKDINYLRAVTYKVTSNESDMPLLDADASCVAVDTVHNVKILDTYGEKYSLPIDTESVTEFLPTLALPEMDSKRNHLLGGPLKPPSVEDEWLSDWGWVQEKRERELYMPLLSPLTRKDTLQRALRRANHPVAKDMYLDLSNLNLSDRQVFELTPENIPYDYECHLRSINYMGPLRSAPERLYRLSAEVDSSAGVTGVQGEFSANALYHNEQTGEDVKAWFKQFEIPYELDVIKLGEAGIVGEHITIALTDKRTDTQVTLADVGYGINQILPVIIEGVASQESSILCVEQPEIHLHPRLQANIADLMIDTIADEPGKRKQWIVETHSELLITRLQRRIREGKLKVEDVSVLYVDPDAEYTEGSAIIPLRMDENGDFIDHWPHGFFNEAFNEEMEPFDDDSSSEEVDVLDELFAEQG